MYISMRVFIPAYKNIYGEAHVAQISEDETLTGTK
jgi:hypothetical protein